MKIHKFNNILWLDPADFLGGAEFFSLDLLPILADEFAITVATNDLGSEFAEKLPATVQKKEFPLPRLRPLTPGNIWKFFTASKRLHAYILENNFALIHTNSIRAHIIAAQALKKVPAEKLPKLIFFVHDFTFPRWAVRIFSRSADQVCACSEAVKRDLVEKGVAAGKISVIPNGVDIEKFAAVPQKTFAAAQPVIGIIGRIDAWKGQDIFLAAAKIVLEKYPQARFQIFGASSAYDPKTQEFEKKLHAIIFHDQKLAAAVEFRGFVPAEEALSELDILVHASTAPEPFGRVILEALAAGVPVIASSLGGAAEIFTSGKEGILISPNDPPLLAEKIDFLLSSPEPRLEFTKNAKALVRAKFNLSQIAAKISALWRKVLSSDEF